VTLTQPAEDRPESDLGKGRYSVPVWTVALLGAAALVMLVAFVVIVVLKRVRARREDLGPISSRGSVRPGPPSSRPRAGS
jgi:hypothetical protein